LNVINTAKLTAVDGGKEDFIRLACIQVKCKTNMTHRHACMALLLPNGKKVRFTPETLSPMAPNGAVGRRLRAMKVLRQG
jgi:hypothetical protein